MNNFSWVIPQKLAGSDIPGKFMADNETLRKDIETLVNDGVRCLVSLQKPIGAIEQICDDFGMEWIYFPVADYDVPSDSAQFSMLVSDIIKRFENNIPVCVHCYAGIGRTGLVLSCVVGKYFGLGAQKAIATVRSVRTTIDTEEQETFVRKFLNSL